MIGWGRQRLRGMLAAMGLGAAMAAMPDLGQQRTLSSRPGSGLVRATGRPKRDSERQMRAVLKRRRKNDKRWRDAIACWGGNRAKTAYPALPGAHDGR